jgi:ribonuclease BN (tRNA processing enzyme)
MTTDLQALQDLDKDEFFFIPLGIGNAFTRRYFNSSFLIACGGKTVLVDAPAPLRRVLADAERLSGIALDLDIVDNIFLTHLHADHCNGLEEIAFWRMFFAPQLPRPRLAVMRSLKETLWLNRLFAAMGHVEEEGRKGEMQLDDYFETITYEENEVLTFGIPGFELIPHRTRHLIPTAGFKARYRGRSLGYSADTEYDPALMEFFADCDVIIHETGKGIGHTNLNDLLALPEKTRDRLMLIHIADDYDIKHSPIPVLEEGRVYRVG